jgi:hypothetical protein
MAKDDYLKTSTQLVLLLPYTFPPCVQKKDSLNMTHNTDIDCMGHYEVTI